MILQDKKAIVMAHGRAFLLSHDMVEDVTQEQGASYLSSILGGWGQCLST